MGIEKDAGKDLSLTDEDAENVAGGSKEHHKPGHHIVAGSVESSDVKTGTPSPLGPAPDESYIDTNPSGPFPD